MPKIHNRRAAKAVEVSYRGGAVIVQRWYLDDVFDHVSVLLNGRRARVLHSETELQNYLWGELELRDEDEMADEAVDELSADEVDAIGLDSTGRDGDPRFPYTEADLTKDELSRLETYRLARSD